MQVTARADNLPLDGIFLKFEVKNSKDVKDFPEMPEKGAYINGLFLEGATWEFGRNGEEGYLTDQQPKDLHPEVPIIHVTAVPND